MYLEVRVTVNACSEQQQERPAARDGIRLQTSVGGRAVEGAACFVLRGRFLSLADDVR